MDSVTMRNKMGRNILRLVALGTIFGGIAADWNTTHLFNPNWPPHAKFHDAMTICLGVSLGALSLFFLSRRSGLEQDNLKMGALLPTLAYVSMALSFIFPNTAGVDAEFPDLLPKIGGVVLNELPLSIALLTLVSIGYGLARSKK